MGEKFKDFFAPIDAQLKVYKTNLKKLKENLKEGDYSQIFKSSMSTAHAHYLLDDEFSYGDIELQGCYLDKDEDYVDFKIELNKRIQKFNRLSKEILKVNKEMHEFLENVQNKKGKKERRKLIKRGYIPPIDFINYINRQIEEEILGIVYREKESDPAFA